MTHFGDIWIRARNSGFLKRLGALSVANGINAALSFPVAILFTRYLGAGPYGLLSLSLAAPPLVFNFMTLVSRDAMTLIAVRFKNDGDGDGIWSVVLFSLGLDCLVGLAGAAICFFGAEALAVWVIKAPEAAGYIRLFSFSLLFQAFFLVQEAVFQLFERVNYMAKVQVVTGFLRSGLYAAGVLLAQPLLAFVVIELTIIGIKGAAYSIGMVQALRGYALPSPAALIGKVRTFRREYLSYCGHSWAITTLTSLWANTDLFVLGYLSNLEVVGQYRFAKLLLTPVTLGLGPIYTIIYPRVTELVHSARLGELAHYLKRITYFTLAATLALGLAAFGAFELLSFWGAIKTDYGPSGDILLLFILAAACSLPFSWSSPFLFAIRKPELLTWITVGGLVCYWGLALAWVPSGGGLAMAAVFNIIQIFYAITVILLTWRYFRTFANTRAT